MIIVGLGNPDKRYENTYHNVGFMTVDKLAELTDVKFKNKECKSLTATSYKGGAKIVLAKPQTYMNLSGETVVELVGKYSANLAETIIIFDDVDLPCGDTRMRNEGSGGTHNGMKNIVALTKSRDIPRIRIGIGKPQPPMQLVDYVLARISGDNKPLIDNAVEKVAKALNEYISDKDMDKLMRKING